MHAKQRLTEKVGKRAIRGNQAFCTDCKIIPAKGTHC